MQLPRHHRIKATPHTSLNEVFCFNLSTCLRPVPSQCVKSEGTGEERVGGWVSSCARCLRESARHLVGFLTWTEHKIKIQKRSPNDGFMLESLRDFSIRYTHRSQHPPASHRQLFKTELYVPQTKHVAINLKRDRFRFYFQNKAETPRVPAYNIQINVKSWSSEELYRSEGADPRQICSKKYLQKNIIKVNTS